MSKADCCAVLAVTGAMVPDPAAYFEQIGTPFLMVRFYIKDRWYSERQVYDPEVMEDVIYMRRRDLGASRAVWAHAGKWCVMGRNGAIRDFPNEEAAEMVAMHNG